jgi:thiol-disulfide isomerase/thioredoxin
MKKILSLLLVVLVLISCKDKTEPGRFTVNGELKNAPDQKVYLEQLFFSQKDPEVLDTAEIKNGKFTVTTIGNEEGLYRLRLEKSEAGFIFINDQPAISFKGDLKEMTLKESNFKSPANYSFNKFLNGIDERQSKLDVLSREIDSLQKDKKNDSLTAVTAAQINRDAVDFKNYVLKNIDTLSDPVVAMFALGYTRGIDPKELQAAVPALGKRFPKHQGIAGIITQYNDMMAKKNEPAPAAPAGTKPGIGNIAPEITMTDTSGKSFSLSSLKGKYVLVDFWASWCAPCRGENPNVVANYKKYKNKNFTILGVSLDDDKAAWTKAIRKDSLAWMQVSDLKGWSSAAATAYGFDGIPYNVLLDPQGKIIATELREAELGKKLAEVLK